MDENIFTKNVLSIKRKSEQYFYKNYEVYVEVELFVFFV